MKKLNQRIKLKNFYIPLLVLLSFSVSNISLPTPHSKNTVAVRQKLVELIELYHIPGAVLSYGFNDEPLTTISVGCASLEPKNVMTDDSLFLMGSITKSFTAAIILKLVEQHKIRLNETLTDIAGNYGGEIRLLITKYPDLGPMTIKDLLNHTSGVPQSINTESFKKLFSENPKKYYSPRALIDIAMQHPVYFKPGSKGMWSYTNTDYILLGVVIQDVTKKSLLRNFNELFLTVNIDNLYFPDKGKLPVEAKEKLSSGYISTRDENVMNNAFRSNIKVFLPGTNGGQAYQIRDSYNIFSPAASGLITTAPALVKWYRILFQGGFLNEESIGAMLKTVSNGIYNQAASGLGVTVHMYPGYGDVISHDGLSPGYSSIIMYFKKYKLTLALATNSSNSYVSTFQVNTGEIIPGILPVILPLILKEADDKQ